MLTLDVLSSNIRSLIFEKEQFSMHKKDVIQHFGGTTEVARWLNISQSAVSQWPDIIPEKQAFKIERLTQGHLKHEPLMYQKGGLHAL